MLMRPKPVPLVVITLALIFTVTALISGCAAAGRPARRATTASCFAFGVQALKRRETVTRLPRACAGLSREQVNAAVDRALREVVGPLAKAPFRSRARAESRYLADLVQSVPPARPPAHRATRVSAATGLPASCAALGCWMLTASAGLYLLAGWLTRTRSGRRRFRAAGMPPAVIGGHAGLGLAGLGVWIAFMSSSAQALAWIAVGITFLAAGLGMATLLTAVSEPQQSDTGITAPPMTGTPAATAADGLTTAGGPQVGIRTASARTAAPKRPGGRPPVLVIALHGVLATITILLVLLAAIGAG
jgi:manganese efflux pump family protein